MITDPQGRKWLTGDGTWFFKAMLDAENLKVSAAEMTWFGVDDPQDNGLGAWGFRVKDHPTFLGVALPLAVGPCKGSPIPYMPHNAQGVIVDHAGKPVEVRIYSHTTRKTCLAQIVDLGPSKFTGHAIDAMPQVWRDLGLSDFEGIGVTKVDFAVLGGVAFVK